MQTMERLDLPALFRGLGLLGVVAAIGVWGYLLSVPMPAVIFPDTEAEPSGDATTQKVVQWFVPGPIRMDVQASGLMFSDSHAVAVLSVNGAPPRAYAVGDKLADSVTVHGIEPNAVVVNKAGEMVRIAAPELPSLGAGGITRVPGMPAAR